LPAHNKSAANERKIVYGLGKSNSSCDFLGFTSQYLSKTSLPIKNNSSEHFQKKSYLESDLLCEISPVNPILKNVQFIDFKFNVI